LAHNHWERPICFTTTIGNDNLIGLQPYLYKEGFTYRLIPFEKDTTKRDQLGKANTMVMYNNVMNKFKFGNFKNARYLDHESTSMFYPVMTSTFIDLAQNLMQEGHNDLALKVLHKYDQEMPDITPYIDVAGRKLFLAQLAFQLNDVVMGKKLVKSIDDYVIDQLDYNYYLLSSGASNVNMRDVQISMQLLNGISDFSKESKQTAITNQVDAQLKDYMKKFAPVLGGGQ
jgi:hypothetical protein